jgi:deoxyribonuclease V
VTDAPAPPWPKTPEQAIAEQERLRSFVTAEVPGPQPLRLIAGVDVAYAPGSDLVAGAVVVLDAVTLETVDQGHFLGVAEFPYVPGLFAFRELPPLLRALERLTLSPDLIVCDGYGLAHPRRFGLASHLGVLLGLPTIGVAKTAFVGQWSAPGARRGEWSTLVDAGEPIGRVLRTREGVKPVFVSVGHRTNLDTAVALTLALTPRYRLPETTRLADRLSRELIRQAVDAD